MIAMYSRPVIALATSYDLCLSLQRSSRPFRQESSRANRTNPKAIIVVDIRSEKDILPSASCNVFRSESTTQVAPCAHHSCRAMSAKLRGSQDGKGNGSYVSSPSEGWRRLTQGRDPGVRRDFPTAQSSLVVQNRVSSARGD